MSTISAFQPFTSIYQPNHSQIARQNHSSSVYFQRNAISIHNFPKLRVAYKSKSTIVRSAEEEAQVPEPDAGTGEDAAVATAEQPVAVPVSPSDKLVMFFQAEGTMNDSAISTVTQALEGTEGISDLKVQIFEGIASVELMKQTTIQATGVASGLVEAIQGAGFKLQTLNLSFEDEELLTV